MRTPDSRAMAHARRWKRITRALQVIVALNLAVAVWVVGFRGADGPAPVLPDTTTQFSLDLSVIDTVDHDVVYAVEQRARPYYRIFSLAPATGEVETVFTVPTNAIIYGIALSPDRETLAVGYSPDFNHGGSGIWLLDLDSQEFTQHTAPVTNIYLTDVAWSSNGEYLLATHVDRSGSDEVLSAVQLAASDASVITTVRNAINPVQIDDSLYYLAVDDTKARRSIGVLEPAGAEGVIDVEGGQHDLDHLTASPTAEQLNVAVIETSDAGLTIGDIAEAHGNHDVPSQWWHIELSGGSTAAATPFEPIIVFDAAGSTDGIVYATTEGLAIATHDRVDVIKSRAIRFVAA